MLQIIIVNEPNSLYISEIKDLESMSSLAVFDESNKCIDLSCLKSHIGETILVTHFTRNDECTRLEYEDEKTLNEVGVNNDGLMYIQYN